MLSAINVPKSKSITIAFIALKAMVLGIIICIYAKSHNQQCSQNYSTISQVSWVFFLLGAVLDLLSLIYFYITKNFSRLEYYVFFGFHLLMTGMAIIMSFSLIKQFDTSCHVGKTFLGTILSLNLSLVCSIFFIMLFNLYFVLKFAHFGCNIVWTFLWLSGMSDCHHLLVSVIGCIHGLLSVAGLICFIVMNVMKKTSFTSKCWKQLYIISIVLLIFCYIANLLASTTDVSCPGTYIFVDSYKIFGILELLSPILLLMFLNTEMGDPRQILLKQDVKVFSGNRQNINFVVNDVQ